MPRISVIIPTYRLGGMDVLLWGLRQQIFTDFEFVLVDGLFERRHEELIDRFYDAHISLVHVPPRLRNFPQDSCAQYRNTAISCASGELLVWATDYSFAHPEWLIQHWWLYEKTGGEYTLAAPHEYVLPPMFRGGIPWWAPTIRKEAQGNIDETYRYDSEASLCYAKEVLSGMWDSHLWSIFDESLASDDLLQMRDDAFFSAKFRHVRRQDMKNSILLESVAIQDSTEILQPDPKHQLLMTEPSETFLVPGELLHFKNESCTRQACVVVNGFDEYYDGAHSYDDIDMGKRLIEAGTKWLLGPSPLRIINVRHYFPAATRSVYHRANEKYYESLSFRSRVAANPYSLGDSTRWYRP